MVWQMCIQIYHAREKVKNRAHTVIQNSYKACWFRKGSHAEKWLERFFLSQRFEMNNSACMTDVSFEAEATIFVLFFFMQMPC